MLNMEMHLRALVSAMIPGSRHQQRMHTFHGRLDELGVGLHSNQAIGVDRDMDIVECVYCADHSYSGTQGWRRCADDASLRTGAHKSITILF
jgi:hypothetical protein